MARDELVRGVARAREYLLSQQATDGSFPGTADVGPSYTAMPILAMHYAGVDYAAEDLARFVAYFRAEQREDGSFVPYPFANTGDLCATALVWAAMRVAGLPAHDPAVARAWSFVSERGGLGAVARAFFAQTNFAALFLVMAGFLDPDELPLPPPAVLLSAPVQRFLTGRYDYLNVVVSMVATAAVVDDRRRKRQLASPSSGAPRRGFASRLVGAVASVGAALGPQDQGATLRLLERYQNPNGSLDDTSLQTALLVAAYYAVGVNRDDPRLQKAAKWLRGMVVRRADGGAWISCFTGDVWGTGFALQSMLALGVPHDADPVARAVRHLLAAQVTDEQRVISPMRPGAPRDGGWGFEATNITMPDCDDTGIALAALGLVRRAASAAGEDAMLVEHVFQSAAAMRRGCAWLEGMQTPDGGWSAFEWSTRPKPRGPLLTEQVGIDFADIPAAIRGAIDPPRSLGSPAWEDITARVLLGLGAAGYDLDRPVVWRAREFLRNQQLDHGGFWGRWMVNYLPTTAFVLVGLAAVGDPLTEPWTKRAIDFLLEHQNFDGGWGERETTYAKPSLAGTGPSVPGLTGVVVAALVRIGLGGSRAAQRGIRYLLDRQRPDGGWDNEQYLHAFFPPQSFYHLSLTSFLHPSEALGCYLRDQEQTTGPSR